MVYSVLVRRSTRRSCRLDHIRAVARFVHCWLDFATLDDLRFLQAISAFYLSSDYPSLVEALPLRLCLHYGDTDCVVAIHGLLIGLCYTRPGGVRLGSSVMSTTVAPSTDVVVLAAGVIGRIETEALTSGFTMSARFATYAYSCQHGEPSKRLRISQKASAHQVAR